MKPGYQVIFSLVVAMLAWGSSAKGNGTEENGVIIIAHASYQFCPYPTDNTIVIVSSDAELADLAHKFSTGTEDIYITVAGDNGAELVFEARMKWVDHERLTGQGFPFGQPIQLVNFSYASRHGWLPKHR